MNDQVEAELNRVKQELQQLRAAIAQNPPPQQVARVSAKIPPFWRNRPKLWFAQVEANFATAGVVNDETKFNTLIASIDASDLECCEDIVLNPPAAEKYKALKDKLIQEASGTESQRINKLLSELQLGDRKPTRLLADMEDLAGQTITGSALETIFLSKLPRHTAEIVTAAVGTLKERAAVGDKVQEVSKMSVASLQSTQLSAIDEMKKTLQDSICRLERRMDQKERSRSKSRARSPTPSRRSQSNGSQDEDDVCWYHRTFGERARKCRKNCKFESPKNK